MAKSKVFATLLFVLIVVIPSTPSPRSVAGSSRFYFPHFVSADYFQTTFIVSNSGATDAEVVFTAYDDNGDVISGGSNPASVTIFADSQARLNFSDLFHIDRQKPVTGWVKAESANLQLSAWMMMSLDSIQGDQLDGLLVSDQTANRMAFSAVFQTADTVTGIGLANPNSQAAHVKASLYSEGGLADMRDFQIPAYGHRAWLLHDLFRSNETVGHVEIDSNVGLVGFQQFSQEHEWSAVPMQLPEETSELVIPLPDLGNLDNHWVGIAVANLGDFDLDLTLTAWGRGLKPLAAPVKRLVKSHAELVSLVSDLFGNLPFADAFISVTADLGPARIFGGKPAISGLAVVGRDDLRALASIPIAGVPLPTLHIESSERGFFIIPRYDPAAAISAIEDKQKDKDKEKDKDKDKEQGKCKDKGKDDTKDKDKCGLSIRVVGNHLVNGSRQIVRLLGVNRSGTQYSCVFGGVFDGPTDTASVRAMSSWNINTVRIPLNEHCWLGINGVDPAVSGENYQNAIVNYVNLLHQYNLYAILELHWNAPGTRLATGPQVMPDLDHSPAFWTSVATKFKNDPAVLLDLYNEPNSISDACWRDGCMTPEGWQAAGMQLLINTIRATGATQPILLSGNRYGNDLSGWLNFKPRDPLESLVASAHTYNFNGCISEACWNSTFRPVAAAVPLVSAEIGEDDCAHGFIDTYMDWLDSVGAGYLGWSWITSSCAVEPALILDYSGTPTNYGIGLRNHLLSLTTQPAITKK